MLPGRMVRGVEGLGPSLSGTFPPPWTVTHSAWQTALRPDVSGIAVDACLLRPDVDWYTGTEYTRIPRLLSCVSRTMAIAQLTHLRISVPVSGRHLVRCQLIVIQRVLLRRTNRVSGSVLFAEDVTPSVCSPEHGTPRQLVSVVAEDDVITPVGETTGSSDAFPNILPPPPGFSQFSWPFDDWSVSNEQSRFAFNVDSRGCAPDVIAGRPGVEPPLKLSPITLVGAADSVSATTGSSGPESVCPPEVGVLVSTLVDVSLDAFPNILPPPPGFSQFSWPFDDWSVSNEQSRFAFNVDSRGCAPDFIAGRPGVEPPLKLSLITPVGAADSVSAIMGSSGPESVCPPEVGVLVSTLVDVSSDLTVDVLRTGSPLPSGEGLLQDIAVDTSCSSVSRRRRSSRNPSASVVVGSGRSVPSGAVA